MTQLHAKVQQRLDRLVARANELMALSVTPEVLADPEQMSKIHRELGGATPVVRRYQDFQKKVRELDDNRSLLDGDDADLAELAGAEIPDLEASIASESEALLDLMLADVGDDRRNCIVEIRAGTGGDEAALFVRDLIGLYQRYGARMGWSVACSTTCSSNRAAIACNACPRPRPRAACIRPPRRLRCSPKSKRSRSTLTRRTCAWTPIAPAVRVASTSTRPTPRCALRTSRPAPWSPARRSAAS
ncbi:MAG TPA: PCRF domain-containing protein [Planctomycetes bacterium]|nr:PCRF domain-containing protein [Planctomycetota bacterium]